MADDSSANLMHQLVEDPVVLANLLQCLQPKEWIQLVCLNKKWAQALTAPVVWEIIAKAPYKPLLQTCFRRASSYCYREVDIPAPNVNRRGNPPVVRACLWTDDMTLREYCDDLRQMNVEQMRWNQTQKQPKQFLKCPEQVDSPAQRAHLFENLRFLPNEFNQPDQKNLFSGDIVNETAQFYLWDLQQQSLTRRMTQNNATCFHSCNEALAVGCADGNVKVWDFRTTSNNIVAPPTISLSHRSSIGIVPFLRPKTREKVVQVFIGNENSSYFNLATSTEKGEISLWDLTKEEVHLTISSSRIHASMLPRSERTENPQITSIMIHRGTLICGTSCGFIRVFDMRNGKLVHRLAGHPDAVTKTDTKARVLWSVGKEGCIRWWGGKSAKVLSKSALCDGGVSCLEMDDNVVVAGYDKQGMEAWDIRTQQPLCSFSNSLFGATKSLQFDSRKILSVSARGKAAVWRWCCPQPVQWFDAQSMVSSPSIPSSVNGVATSVVDGIESDNRIVSGRFHGQSLVFGTSSGELWQF